MFAAGFAASDFADSNPSGDAANQMPMTSYHPIISSPSASVSSDAMSPRPVAAAALPDSYAGSQSRSPYRHVSELHNR